MSSERSTVFRVRITCRANRDLDAIFLYIEAETPIAAHRWFSGLIAAIESFAAEPQRSPATVEDPALYHLLYGNKPHIYRIIYEIDFCLARGQHPPRPARARAVSNLREDE